jgi:hypothetical protein
MTSVSGWPRLLKFLALDRCSDLHACHLVSIDALRGVAVLVVVVAYLRAGVRGGVPGYAEWDTEGQNLIEGTELA